MSEENTQISVGELSSRSDDELLTLLREKQGVLRQLTFSHRLGQLRNTASLRTCRRDVARLKTLLSARG